MSGPEPTPAAGENTIDHLADIFDRARERNLGRAKELAGWVAVAEQNRLTSGGRAEAKEIAHQLAGSAGTFGYQPATELARKIESLFADGGDEQCWARAREDVAELMQQLHEPPS